MLSKLLWALFIMRNLNGKKEEKKIIGNQFFFCFCKANHTTTVEFFCDCGCSIKQFILTQNKDQKD